MKPKYLSIGLFFLSGLINSISCQPIPVLNLSSSFEHLEKINLSDFIESIHYIPLATSPECFVDINPDVLATKEHIIITTSEKCLLFDRKSGAFIREIGHYGRDPGGYRNTYGFFNEYTSMYYFIGWSGNLVKYSLDGTFKGNVKIPGFDENFDNHSVPDVYSFLNDKILVCNFGILIGTETKSMMIFSEKGDIIKIFPNNYILKKKQLMVGRTKEIRFHHFNSKLFFQSMYNDTVFNLTQNQIVPSFVLNRGKHRPTFESRWWPIEEIQQSDFIYQPEYFEDLKFISFNLYLDKGRYFALYDKTLKSIKVTEFRTGLNNNIDGFIDLRINSINNEGELSCLIQATELFGWIKQNPNKFNSLKPELQKLKSVKIEDNPIVVIAKYKR